MPGSRRSGLSFFEMVGGVMALLHLKGKYDEYKQTAADDEEGRVALTSPSVENMQGREEAGIALLDTEIPASSRRTTKKKACCMCYGFDCSLFWKAVGIVLAFYTFWLGFKMGKWALSDAPTGLESMPVFGTSLQCPSDAPFIYNGTEMTIATPIGTRGLDHVFDIRGSAVGTIIVADGDADSKDVKYAITLRSNNKEVAQDLAFVYPDVDSDTGVVTRSRLIIETSRMPALDAKKCMRFDITMYVPPTLKRLHVASHAGVTHLRFAPGSRAAMDELIVTLYSTEANNLIVPSIEIAPDTLSLEVYRGWIVGEASIVKETSVVTQRGDGVANVRFTPASSQKAVLRTTSGAGRSDFKVIKNEKFTNQIEATHVSSRNADIYLTYADSGFNGKIDMDSRSYTITGAQGFANSDPSDGTTPKFTHYYGSISGEDRIFVNSRGWTGLYF